MIAPEVPAEVPADAVPTPLGDLEMVVASLVQRVKKLEEEQGFFVSSRVQRIEPADTREILPSARVPSPLLGETRLPPKLPPLSALRYAPEPNFVSPMPPELEVDARGKSATDEGASQDRKARASLYCYCMERAVAPYSGGVARAKSFGMLVGLSAGQTLLAYSLFDSSRLVARRALLSDKYRAGAVDVSCFYAASLWGGVPIVRHAA